MAGSIVQSAAALNLSAAASIAKAFGSNNTAHNCLLVVSVWDPGGAVPTIADSLGNTYSNPGVPALSSLASFRTANGSDAHSAIGSPTFTSPTSLNPLGFQLMAGTAGSASGSTPGRIGGVVGGALTDMGAWGGASPPVGAPGCGF